MLFTRFSSLCPACSFLLYQARGIKLSFITMKRHFESSDHAKSYNQFRPVYPPNVLKNVIEYYGKESENYERALDIGCGSGQSTVQLAEYFDSVTGMDVSEAQITQAPSDLPKVNFLVGPAEDLSRIADNSVNLITVAQAFHWLDTDKFYSEANRVLKSKGVLAVYGYGNLSLNKEDANKLVCNEFYYDLLKKGGYWDSARQHIDDKYTTFNLPFRDFQRIDHLVMEKEWSLPEFVGYVKSWSGYREYKKQNPDSGVLEDISHKLERIYKSSDKLKVQWPIFILLGRK